MFDCHVHSSFSGDSEMPAEAACEKAIEVGLDGIAFTDHTDIDFPGSDFDFMIDYDEYFEFMDKLAKKYEGRLKVLKGIEAGIQPHVMDDTSKIIKNYDFDFVIGSIHVVDGKDTYKPSYFEGLSKHEAYSKDLKAIAWMVKEFDDFDIAGHFDYIIRKAPYEDRNLRYCEFSDIFDEIFKSLIAKGKGFEVNTSSFREYKGIITPVYDIDILKRYHELGGEIITFGSDSHTTEYLGYKFDFYKCVLQEIGFKYVAHYEKRKPVFEKIDD
ncbi:histidinol-phosphatase HisJ family protein [Pseudoclostridium thermosuccinogenes]|jgi:histidinol-phosphatase (PHP family)|uniref:histidinol-phosphatase HisJ family protein n=1 Tax=Clostridium thermosuccinogenes TaxID=84032 RepID=UPI000CCC3EE5|nr:histidinol-phosphatase HisJ family protein [Pseudoclostridium thermosuccinogenes]PNT92809.1 histidinol phosphate phosphatase [Pseudoclostridium thermosuccinogenes]